MSKITDPRMKPYYIGKDSHCYTVYEVVTPQEKYLTDFVLDSEVKWHHALGQYESPGRCSSTLYAQQWM